MPQIEFTAPLVAVGPKKAWTVLWLPEAASARLGTRGRVSVVGTMNGYPFRTSAAPSGTGTHILTVNKALQQGAKAVPGDEVRVVLAPDTDVRTVDVPDDLRAAVADSPKAEGLWGRLTPRCRQEWIDWVVGAKKPETRARRIAAAVERLEAGKRRVDQ